MECKDSETKGYQSSDCSWGSLTRCDFHCNNGQCLKPGDDDFCSPTNRCKAGQGDCDTDADCKDGLRCIADIGDNFGLPAGTDICEYRGDCNCRCNSAGITGCKNWDNSVGEYDIIATAGSAGDCGPSGCSDCEVFYGQKITDCEDPAECRTKGIQLLKNSGYLPTGPFREDRWKIAGLCTRWHGRYNDGIRDNNGIYREYYIHTEGIECDPIQVTANPICKSQFAKCAIWHYYC
jgi:hypothetical protein